jgi:ammonia channel protein AmtB
VSEQAAFWLIGAGVVSLAALLLWLRDRFRDFRHVPEAERKRSQQRNATGATAFVCLVWTAWFAFHAFQTAAVEPRVVFTLIAIAFLGVFWQSYKQYRKIGRAK